MSRFRVFKELKKSLRRKRRHVWSLGIGAAVFLLASLAGSWLAYRVIKQTPSEVFLPAESTPVWMDGSDHSPKAPSREKALHALKGRREEVELVLHRTYLCGEETRRLGRLPASEAEELLKAHREWDAKLDTAVGKLTMEESVDDLSPQCRQTAYIGMDKDGNLSLYDGPPWKEKVIRTFFQLDVDMLESRMSEDRVRELAEGIRVSDKEEYNSVLSTFNEYASLKSNAVPRS
ncbi:BofC C-terminal domain-containing protein [Cohnella terricola]|uniref:Bypass of forespore C C-terminal domain-containing protein n=1 Tax=Cohnella terricola TaxID=1289167 RepID=A0A559JW16_9BACL|nr:BofC C-terminal domain-containing protein [Cohnella terricola]TVY04073.1 hypothetical protein FPZ45_00245 [Cohnella terricola]